MKGLESTVEKNSLSLGRTALYTKSAKISKLPKFLITQVLPSPPPPPLALVARGPQANAAA